jgi:hypothetical protein
MKVFKYFCFVIISVIFLSSICAAANVAVFISPQAAGTSLNCTPSSWDPADGTDGDPTDDQDFVCTASGGSVTCGAGAAVLTTGTTFNITSDTCSSSTVTNGNTCTVNVEFPYDEGGPYSDTLTITSDADSDNGPYSLGPTTVAAAGSGVVFISAENVFIQATQDPDAVNLTIPADATAVYMFWAYFVGAGNGLNTVTLNSQSPAQTYEIETATGDMPALGVTVWYNPSTGTQSLDVSWDAAINEGPTCAVAYVKGGNTSAWRDADAAQGTDTGAVSVTLTTSASDLVLKFDRRYTTTPPGTSTGWTDRGTQNNNSQATRLSSADTPGTSTVCDSEDESFSGIVAVAIPAGS